MVHMKKTKKKSYRALSLLIPLALSFLPLLGKPILGILLLSLSILFVIAYTPFFRHRETLYTIVLVSIFMIPINLRCFLILLEFFRDTAVLLRAITMSILLTAIVFSVELVLFAVITRRLYKRQYRIFPKRT